MNGVIGIRASRPVSEPTKVAKPVFWPRSKWNSCTNAAPLLNGWSGGNRRRHAARVRVAELRCLGVGRERGERLRPQRPEEPERGADGGVAEIDQRADVEDLDLEDVAGLGAFDVDRAGERVDPAQVDGHRAVGGHGPRLVADVERVAAQQLDLLAGPDGHCRGQVAVPPVVHDAAVAVEDPVATRERRGHRGVPEPAMSTAPRPPASASSAKA